MEDQDSNKKYSIPKDSGLEIKCHKCGQELPLLHSHIMVERNDEEGNLICEECYSAANP